MEEEINFLEKWKKPQLLRQMEDNLNILDKWKMTLTF